MLITRDKLFFWIKGLSKERKYLTLYIFSSLLLSYAGRGLLLITAIMLSIYLRDNQLLTDRYHKNILNLYNNIFEKSNYNNEKEIEKLLLIKAYFFFKYPFHKHYHQIYIYLKYFLFISYFMNKNYKKAYELVTEMDEFVEKYVIDANKEINEENEKISEKNERRRKWKRKEINLIPEIDYPKDYTKEEIEGKKLLFYLEDEKDEYAIKLKNLFLEKKKLYDKKPS